MLKEQGVFSGFPDGESGLDQKMNRAQFARVAALILDLEGIGTPDTKVVTEKPFDDTALDAWYIEEVAAVKEANIIIGNADGTFSPNKDMTIQEMAVATASVLDMEPEEDANIEGASDWASGYIQALKNAGVDLPNNYTDAAIRSDLVNAAFQAETMIAEMNEAAESSNWDGVDESTFAEAGATGETDDNLDGILEAIGEAKSTPRGPFDPPFSLTSRNDLQQVVNHWVAQNRV